MLRGLYASWAFWHGLVPGWPPLRWYANTGDRTWETTSKHSKIRLVAEAIDREIGVAHLPGSACPSEEQTKAAFRFCSKLETTFGNNSFTAYYTKLSHDKKQRRKSGSAAGGVATVAAASRTADPSGYMSADSSDSSDSERDT